MWRKLVGLAMVGIALGGALVGCGATPRGARTVVAPVAPVVTASATPTAAATGCADLPPLGMAEAHGLPLPSGTRRADGAAGAVARYDAPFCADAVFAYFQRLPPATGWVTLRAEQEAPAQFHVVCQAGGATMNVLIVGYPDASGSLLIVSPA